MFIFTVANIPQFLRPIDTRNCAVLAASVALVGGSEQSVTVIDGEDVQLRCNLPLSDPPAVEWVDFVYNDTPEPQLIFTSENNPDFQPFQQHPNAAGYTVSADFALTIRNVDIDNDPGEYICRSKEGGKTHHKKYYLTTGSERRLARAIIYVYALHYSYF